MKVRLSLGCLALLFGACDSGQSVNPTTAPVDALVSMHGLQLMAPSNVKATAVSETQVDVSWQDNSSNEAGFEARRSSGGSSVIVARTAANVVGFSDRGLASGTSYCYDVRAVRDVGANTIYSTFSASVCAATLVPPPPPPPPPTAASNAMAWPMGSTTVRVTWTADNTATGFRVQRSSDGGATWPWVIDPGLSTTADDHFAPSEQILCYRVVAINAGGQAPPSNTACTIAPAAPSQLGATVWDAATLELTWVDNSAFESGYLVWFHEVLQDEFGNQVPLQWTVAGVPPNVTTARFSPATCDSTAIYGYYTVEATYGGGSGDQSNFVSQCGVPPDGGPIDTRWQPSSSSTLDRRAPGPTGRIRINRAPQ